MSFVSLFGNRAISALSPAFLNSVRMDSVSGLLAGGSWGIYWETGVGSRVELPPWNGC